MTAGFRTTRAYQTLPSLPSRGILPPQIGVILPIARTNLITNPSIELATTNYTAVGGSIARSATQQYHGTYSLAVTPGAGTTDGVYYGTIALTSGTIYAFSCKFRGIAGIPYKISIATTGGVDLSVYTFFGTGRWQWVYGYYVETSSTNRRFYFTKNGSTNTSVFYVDGVQVETINAGETVSTYIDGDQLGLLVNQQPPAYLWTGTPHASTSTRSALTRAGGSVFNLQDTYNFILTGAIGLGMAVPNNVSVPYTVLDGARYLRTTKPPRTISLPGRFQDDDIFSLRQHQSDMRAAFDRDLIPIQQPMVLQVQPQDECGNVIGDFANIQCIYAGGLDGDDSNFPAEDAAPTFTMYVPFLLGGDAGAALTVQQSVSNANNILQRSANGVWSAMGTGANNLPVYAVVQGLDGTIYAGGAFTDMGGSGADFLAKWDGAAWSVVKSATSINSNVYALAVGADGRIYVGGRFTNADGIAAADYITVYDPAANTFAALGTGAASLDVLSLVFDANGNLYAGGTFTQMGGVANTANLAKWNGSAWSSLGVVNNSVFGLAVNRNNYLYAAGDFTTAGGVTVNRVAYYTGTTWVSMGGGSASIVAGLAFGLDGRLYAGGSFTTIGGVSANYVAMWNGTSWAPLSTGLSAGATVANNGVTVAPDGTIYVFGAFTSAGDVALPDRGAARWNGSTWLPLDVDLPGSNIVYAIRPLRDGRLIVGFDTNGTATASGTTTVTNDTPSAIWPRLVINGPSSGVSRIYQFINYTNGAAIYFNYSINVGETITFIFDPQNPSIISSFVGDLSSAVLPGSTPSQFFLSPSANSISFFAGSSTVTAAMSYQNRYNGVADLVN